MPVAAALDALGLYWKRDPDLVPVKDKNTIRLNVVLASGVVERLRFNTKRETRPAGLVFLCLTKMTA